MKKSKAAEAFETLTATGVSVEAWETAYQELESLGAAAAPVLKQGLTSPRQIVREWSASILAANWEAAAESTTELVTCLEEGPPALRANAAAALVLVPGQEGKAIPALVDLSRSSDVSLRRMAAVNLQNVGAAAQPHLDAIGGLLAGDDPEVLRPVIELLGSLGPAAAGSLDRLEKIAGESPDESLQQAARAAIERIKTPTADGGPRL